MSDPVADAINEQAAAIREQTELLRQIVGCLFEIAGQDQDEPEAPGTDRYMDGSPR